MNVSDILTDVWYIKRQISILSEPLDSNPDFVVEIPDKLTKAMMSIETLFKHTVDKGDDGNAFPESLDRELTPLEEFELAHILCQLGDTNVTSFGFPDPNIEQSVRMIKSYFGYKYFRLVEELHEAGFLEEFKEKIIENRVHIEAMCDAINASREHSSGVITTKEDLGFVISNASCAVTALMVRGAIFPRSHSIIEEMLSRLSTFSALSVSAKTLPAAFLVPNLWSVLGITKEMSLLVNVGTSAELKARRDFFMSHLRSDGEVADSGTATTATVFATTSAPAHEELLALFQLKR